MPENNPDRETDPSEMADAIVDAVEESMEDEEDGLTKRERSVEADKESERIRKAKEIKKALRKRELGFLNYRWPAMILVLSGILAISTEFLPATYASDAALAIGVYGFDSFWMELVTSGNLYFAFPLISGVILIIAGILAYTNPKMTFLSILPIMLMASAGVTVYYSVTVIVTLFPDAAGELYATGAPLTMIIVALMALFAIILREKE